jgi:hypothetical protein
MRLGISSVIRVSTAWELPQRKLSLLLLQPWLAQAAQLLRLLRLPKVLALALRMPWLPRLPPSPLWAVRVDAKSEPAVAPLSPGSGDASASQNSSSNSSSLQRRQCTYMECCSAKLSDHTASSHTVLQCATSSRTGDVERSVHVFELSCTGALSGPTQVRQQSRCWTAAAEAEPLPYHWQAE